MSKPLAQWSVADVLGWFRGYKGELQFNAEDKQIIEAAINQHSLDGATAMKANAMALQRPPYNIPTRQAFMLANAFQNAGHGGDAELFWASALLLLPSSLVRQFDLQEEANLSPKDQPSSKTMWMGRVADFAKLTFAPADGPKAMRMFGQANGLQGFVVLCGGSGGIGNGNLRMARAWCEMEYPVLCVDHTGSESKILSTRGRPLRQMLKPGEPTPYDSGTELVYTGEMTGDDCFSSDANAILADRKKWYSIYSKISGARQVGLQTILNDIANDPACSAVKNAGVYLLGNSEGAMVVTKLKDDPWSPFIRGRLVVAYGMEMCYINRSGASECSGRIPTLNIIGTHDEYFSSQPTAVAMIEASHAGYGGVVGHGFGEMGSEMRAAGFEFHAAAAIQVQGGMHDLTTTHDALLRKLFAFFAASPAGIASVAQGVPGVKQLKKDGGVALCLAG